MAFIPACTVELEGVTIDVEPFYIDSFPITYRQILPWMSGVIGSPEDLAAIITGQFDENYQFLSFTPFINSEDGTSLTVPSDCFGIPAASFTWEGASLYLRDQGKQLPTAVQLMAARNAGVLEGFDVYTVMSTYSDVMMASLGNLLGNISNQSMFTGHSTTSERIMWEFARDQWGRHQDEPIDMTGKYRILFKPVDPVQLGAAGRSMGYFNVIFRGVVVLPMEWQ